MAVFDAVCWFLVAVGACFLAAILRQLLRPDRPGRRKRRRRASGAEAIWFWLGTAFLVVAGAMISVAASVHGHSKQALWASGGFVVAYVLGFLAIVCVIAAIKRVPFPPWAKAGFPDLEVEFLGWIGAKKDDDGNVWRAHRVSIFNLDSSRVASLTLDYRAKTDGSTFAAKPINYTPFTRPDLEHTPPEKIPKFGDWLSFTLTIEPGHMKNGFLVSELSRYWSNHMTHNPREEWVEILDHASQKLAKVPIKFGLQDSRSWTITDRYWE